MNNRVIHTAETRLRQPLLCLCIVAFTLVAYVPVYDAGFIWDDDSHLTSNPCIVGPLGFKEIWSTSQAFYYPLVLTSFWIQHAIWGLNPLPYHIVNVLLHAACGVLLWKVLEHLKVPGAWFGAALWALHPVQVESVAWITELKNTQSGFFYLLSILFYLKRYAPASHERPAARHVWYALALLCAVLAILSKSSTVVLPAVLVLCTWWLNSELNWRKYLPLIPFFLISLAASAWTIWEQTSHSGAIGAEWNQTALERLCIAGTAIWFYLSKIFWPHPLIFIYPRWSIDISSAGTYLPLAATAVLLLLTWRFWTRGGRPAFFVLSYFIVALFPVLGFFNIYFFRFSFVADHFQYLASMGPLALTAGASASLLKRFEKVPQFSLLATATFVLAVLGVVTWREAGNYRDNETLWNETLVKNPQCWFAENILGSLAWETKPLVAIEHYRRSLAIKPDYADAHNNLGVVLSMQGRFNESIRHFQEAIEITPIYVEARYNLAKAYAAIGRNARAADEYRRALQLAPQNVNALTGLGNVLAIQGKFAEATELYERALQLTPENAELQNNLGNVLASLGSIDEAMGHYKRAIQIRSDYPEAHNNLGLALSSRKQHAEAIEHYRQAIALRSDYADAYNNAADSFQAQGKSAAALEGYRRAIQIQPRHISACTNLASLLATCPDAALRDGGRALELAQRANDLTNGSNPEVLCTLSEAYAETGRFVDAAEVARKARALYVAADEIKLADQIQRRINLYEDRVPFRRQK